MPLLLFILWIILNGRITLEIILFGIAVSALVSFFSMRVLGWRPSTDAAIITNAAVLALYFLNLIWEIIKASASVMDLLISRGKQPDPVIIEFDSEFTSSFVNVLLANSITLTPGTYTVFHKKNHFAVHCLIPEFAEGIEDSSFVRILRKLR
ncbi:MAG TPA: sodium:proton antiporter [Lachnospiraceae bacterium]|jgi:multicomponent Na+:H+ antiporter subunit E|nr:sodium:proton antiporter [Lachnospiraceae bacterium]